MPRLIIDYAAADYCRVISLLYFRAADVTFAMSPGNTLFAGRPSIVAFAADAAATLYAASMADD